MVSIDALPLPGPALDVGNLQSFRCLRKPTAPKRPILVIQRSQAFRAVGTFGRFGCWDARGFDITGVLLAIVAAAPVLQFASLGYILLYAAGRLANGARWRDAFPGLRSAGKIGTFALLAGLSWIPIYILTDLAYSAQLLQPNSVTAPRLAHCCVHCCSRMGDPRWMGGNAWWAMVALSLASSHSIHDNDLASVPLVELCRQIV